MDRRIIIIFTTLGLLGATACGGDSIAGQADEVIRVDIVVPRPEATTSVYAGGDDGACRTSCSLARHAIAPLTDEQFRAAIDEFTAAPVGDASSGLDTMLFYRLESIERLSSVTVELPVGHREFLMAELGRDTAIVEIRMVDAAGGVRVALGPVPVPLGKKQHLHPEVLGGMQPFTINGTVMRTGLGHIWSRY